MKMYIIRDIDGVMIRNKDNTVRDIVNHINYPVIPGRIEKELEVKRMNTWNTDRVNKWRKIGMYTGGTILGYYDIQFTLYERIVFKIKNYINKLSFL